MPTAVKITDLPALSTVQPGDIVPIVPDPNVDGTQTSSATAGQIAALGGGPPGNNTVSTNSLINGAVTAAKVGFTGPDLLISRIAAGAGQGVEIPCSSYARGLLATVDGTAARLYLNALQSTNNPIFTGQVRVAPGSVGTPAIVGTDDLSTGMFFPEDGAVSFASGNVELWRLQDDGTMLTTIFGTPTLRPSLGARAWVAFNGLQAAGSTFSINQNQRAVAERYGLAGTIGDNATTRAYLESVEAARVTGASLTLPTTPSFNDSYGKGSFPAYNRGTETRANYTSPGNNTHWIWNGSTWVTTPASSIPWIGTLTVNFPINQSPILSSRGIAAVIRAGTGDYTLQFSSPMPDTNYAVIATTGVQSGPTSAVRVHTQTTTSVRIQCVNVNTSTNDTLRDPTFVSVAIFR